MEGFNNVPKILEEARRMVDAVTQSETPPDSKKTTAPVKQEDALVQPVPSEPVVKSKKPAAKRTSTKVAAADKAVPKKKPQAKPAAGQSAPEAVAGIKPPEVPAAPPEAIPPEKFGIRIIHRVPGRTRVKLKQLKYNESFAQSLKERLEILPGIIAVETSTVTGRAVLHYNPGIVCQPSAFQAWQAAWQDLFSGMETEKLVADITCQKLP
jgi:hypothetical protein